MPHGIFLYQTYRIFSIEQYLFKIHQHTLVKLGQILLENFLTIIQKLLSTTSGMYINIFHTQILIYKVNNHTLHASAFTCPNCLLDNEIAPNKIIC